MLEPMVDSRGVSAREAVEALEGVLSQTESRLSRIAMGTQIVLEHYRADDCAAIIYGRLGAALFDQTSTWCHAVRIALNATRQEDRREVATVIGVCTRSLVDKYAELYEAHGFDWELDRLRQIGR